MKTRALSIVPLSLALSLLPAPLLLAQTIPNKPAAETSSGAGSYTVQKGDSLASIARKTGTNATSLAKLNKIKNPAMIRIGQVLKLPGKATKPAVAKEEKPAEKPVAKTEAKPEPKTEPKEAAPKASPGSYTVQAGDTLYSIARKQGISLATLKKANPGVDPSNLKIGQSLKIQGASAEAPSETAKTEPKESTKPQPVETKATKEPEAKTAHMPETKPEHAKTEEAPKHEPVTHEAKTDPSAKPKPAEPQPVATKEAVKKNAPRPVSITIDKEITFGEFAAQHNSTPEELNALNGLTLAPGMVLAKDSELYVPSASQ